MGVHIATGKYTAEHHLDAELTQRYLWTGLLCALCTSIVCFLVLGGGIFAFGLLQKSDVWFATFLTIAALPLFSVNKVALSYLNGLSRMRAYAVFQAMRPILIVLTILACALLSVPGKYLSSAFFVAEFILTIVFFLYVAICRIPVARPRLDLAKELLRFGVFIFPDNLILEFNTRIDIIVLGLFTGNDYLVGIYSFAALFAEGFYQLFVVVRRIINPKITQAYGNQDGLKERLEAIIAPVEEISARWRARRLRAARCRILCRLLCAPSRAVSSRNDSAGDSHALHRAQQPQYLSGQPALRHRQAQGGIPCESHRGGGQLWTELRASANFRHRRLGGWRPASPILCSPLSSASCSFAIWGIRCSIRPKLKYAYQTNARTESLYGRF